MGREAILGREDGTFLGHLAMLGGQCAGHQHL